MGKAIKQNKHIGSDFNDFLKEEGISKSVNAAVKKRMDKKNKYTVIGYHEYDHNLFNSHVTASNPNKAVHEAVKKMEASARNVCIIEVISGHHMSEIPDVESASFASDWPKK